MNTDDNMPDDREAAGLAAYADIKPVILKKLTDAGYGGLYYPGECACATCDLMPCGVAEREDGEEWVNGCEPGFQHFDPSGKTQDFIISARPEPPDQERFDAVIGAV